MSWRRNPADWPHDALAGVTQCDIDMGRRMVRILLAQRLRTLGSELLDQCKYCDITGLLETDIALAAETPEPNPSEVPPE